MQKSWADIHPGIEVVTSSLKFIYFATNQSTTIMYQAISQILSFLLSPLVWILLLIAGSYFVKTAGRRNLCRWAAVIIFLLFSNQWLLDSYARFWQPPPRDISADSAYSCGILLGGYGSPDGQGTLGYFNAGADRFIQAVKLYKLGKIKHLLISGGNGKREVKEFNESAWTVEQLRVMGVPDSVLLFEDQSANTADNATNAKRMLDSAGLLPPYVLITSAYHMPRASLIFSNAGIQHIQYPCNYFEGKGKFSFWDIVPNPNILHGWNAYLKETIGYLLYKIRG